MTELNCPFLGLRDDPDTCKLFPSEHNCCQRALPVEAVALTHQVAYCLSAQHFRCPVFASKMVGPLPAPISASPRRVGNWRWAAVSFAAFTLAIVLGFVGWQSGLPALPPPMDTWTSVPPLASSMTPDVATPAPTETPLPPPSATLEPPSPPPTDTAAPEPPASTATSVVCNPPSNWVIYSVRVGDTLFALSVYYGVPMSDLQRANCLGDNPKLFVGQRLYVPNLPAPTASKPTASPLPPSETAPAATETLQPPTDEPKPLPSNTPEPTETVVPPTETRDIPPPSP